MDAVRVRVRRKASRAFLLLYYTDPVTGREHSKSARTRDRRQAEREASKWEEEIRVGQQVASISWVQFRERFENEHVATLSRDTESAYRAALNWFEKIVGKPTSLQVITTSVLSKFKAKLQDELDSLASVASYLRSISSALSWAAKVGIIQTAPKVLMPKVSGRKLMRSRPITGEEFERILAIAKKHRSRPGDWVRLLTGLWLSGLRLGEALSLSWDSPPLRVDLKARRPRIIVWSEGQKSRTDQAVPITPDFCEFLERTPEAQRAGPVFPIAVSEHETMMQVRAFGIKAKVKVNEKGKSASAHDFRRAFGTRWALRVHPVVLQALMRHKSIGTTMAYYVDLDQEKLSDAIWEAVARVPGSVPKTRDESTAKKQNAP